jgi:hypothetical protein
MEILPFQAMVYNVSSSAKWHHGSEAIQTMLQYTCASCMCRVEADIDSGVSSRPLANAFPISSDRCKSE